MILIAFDLETGGLEPHRHAIIQIAAIAFEFKHNLSVARITELEEFECKIKFPWEAAETEALEGNSFDPVVWEREAIHPDEAATSFAEFCRRWATVDKVSKRGKPYRVARLVGHNAASFDKPFLDAWYKRREVFLPADWWALDTLQIAIALELLYGPRFENHQLGTLSKHYGIDLDGAHDALVDVRATLRLFAALLGDIVKGEST